MIDFIINTRYPIQEYLIKTTGKIEGQQTTYNRKQTTTYFYLSLANDFVDVDL
jgi:hypothetical protein